MRCASAIRRYGRLKKAIQESRTSLAYCFIVQKFGRFWPISRTIMVANSSATTASKNSAKIYRVARNQRSLRSKTSGPLDSSTALYSTMTAIIALAAGGKQMSFEGSLAWFSRPNLESAVNLQLHESKLLVRHIGIC
jgi:hypothetical protein